MTFAAPVETKSIRFRARSFVAFTLTPEAPLDVWLESLDRWIGNSPGYFAGRPVVLDLNRNALAQLRCEKKLEIVPGATHLFEESGALEVVTALAVRWFGRFLKAPIAEQTAAAR